MTNMGRPDLDKITEAQPERDLVVVVRCIAESGLNKILEGDKQALLAAADELTTLRADRMELIRLRARPLAQDNADLTAKLWRVRPNEDGENGETWAEFATDQSQDNLNLTAKCERLSDNLLIRTRELEDRTAELERSKEEIAYNELRWMEHMTLVRNDLAAQHDKAVAALKEVLSALPLESRLRIRDLLEATPEISEAMVERAAKAIAEEIDVRWDGLLESEKEEPRRCARAALEARKEGE